jgi:uncharacterized membrane protein
MTRKLDVSNIIRSHYGTLIDVRTKRIGFGDILCFGLIPVSVSVGLFMEGIRFNATAVSLSITGLSVLAGLLFNLLLLTQTVGRQRRDDSLTSAAETALLREVFNNIAFAILVALVCIILCVLWSLLDSAGLVAVAVELILYTLLSLFILTLLMVLKRIHVILSQEFS